MCTIARSDRSYSRGIGIQISSTRQWYVQRAEKGIELDWLTHS